MRWKGIEKGLTPLLPRVDQVLHTLVTGRSRKISHVMQEQASGIVAERSEAMGDAVVATGAFEVD